MSTTAEQSLTHHVQLILDNDEGLYNMRRKIIARNIDSPADAADELRSLYESLVGLNDEFGTPEPNLPATEILSTALAFVDWRGMAADYIAEESE